MLGNYQNYKRNKYREMDIRRNNLGIEYICLDSMNDEYHHENSKNDQKSYIFSESISDNDNGNSRKYRSKYRNKSKDKYYKRKRKDKGKRFSNK